MSSNMRIPKVCEFCGKEFIAMKLTTKCCSLGCGQRNYKKVKRDEKIVAAHKECKEIKQKTTPYTSVKISVDQKPYLSIKDACTLLNASDTTIRKAIKDGILPTLRIGKKHIIRRLDIEKLFKLA